MTSVNQFNKILFYISERILEIYSPPWFGCERKSFLLIHQCESVYVFVNAMHQIKMLETWSLKIKLNPEDRH